MNLINILKKAVTFIKKHKFLFLMILLLILIREGMVIFDMWTAKEGGDLPEALIAGNFAFDVLDRTWRGWDTYLYIRRGSLGNELMMGIFALPLYFFFGNSLFVLCQAQILSSVAILVLMYYFCRMYFGETVAKIAALLFVSFPLNIQNYLIYPNYLYFDNSFYTLLAFLLFAKVMNYNKKSKKLFWYLIFLGIVSGIGIFHTEIHFLTILCILFFWFLNDKLFFIKRNFFVFLLGLVIGLIPVFCFGFQSYLLFCYGIFSGKISYSYEADRIANSYRTALGLMSMGFWPIKTALFSLVNNQIITILGIVVSIITVLWTKINNKLHLAFRIVVFYVFAFLLISFVKKGSLEYYFHPLLVPTTIVLAIFIYNVQMKWFSKIHLRWCFYAALFFICFSSIYEIARHFDFKNSIPQFKKQLNINGCCYYWPGEYNPPYGWTTESGLKVENIAVKTRFLEYREVDESVPLKAIYISNLRTGEYPLLSPQDYAVYGIDVSFAGFEALSREIREQVPENAKSYAYMGLAVYYVNDNWLVDLLKDFESGIIEKNIPLEFQPYFYQELSRKIANRYFDNMIKARELFSRFTDSQKKWMSKTKLLKVEKFEREKH